MPGGACCAAEPVTECQRRAWLERPGCRLPTLLPLGRTPPRPAPTASQPALATCPACSDTTQGQLKLLDLGLARRLVLVDHTLSQVRGEG